MRLFEQLASGNTPMCDWLTVSQVHPESVPQVTKEHSFTFDTETGEMLYEMGKGIKHEGSHSTSIRVKSMGGRVELSGNVGRWGRADNVFGFDVETVKRKANEIVESLGLPPFSDGEQVHIAGSRKTDGALTQTGAKVSRLDLTRNYATGSLQNSQDFKYWLSTQKLDRKEPSLRSNTLTFGADSKYSTLKIYTKGIELRNHSKRQYGKGDDNSRKTSQYIDKLADWCDAIGLTRIERVLQSRYLSQNGLRHWKNLTNEAAMMHYEKTTETLNKRCTEYHDIDTLKPAERGIYHSYMRGDNLNDYNWSRATFFRYRKRLLTVGIDIARPLNVKAINIRPRIIELTAASVPSFYQLPEAA